MTFSLNDHSYFIDDIEMDKSTGELIATMIAMTISGSEDLDPIINKIQEKAFDVLKDPIFIGSDDDKVCIWANIDFRKLQKLK